MEFCEDAVVDTIEAGIEAHHFGIEAVDFEKSVGDFHSQRTHRMALHESVHPNFIVEVVGYFGLGI